MKKSTLIFFFAVVTAVVIIARYNSRSSRLAEERLFPKRAHGDRGLIADRRLQGPYLLPQLADLAQ